MAALEKPPPPPPNRLPKPPVGRRLAQAAAALRKAGELNRPCPPPAGGKLPLVGKLPPVGNPLPEPPKLGSLTPCLDKQAV